MIDTIDTILAIAIIGLFLVSVQMLLNRMKKASPKQNHKKDRRENLPDVGDQIKVKIGGKECRAVLLDSPKEKKKAEPEKAEPEYVPRAWR